MKRVAASVLAWGLATLSLACSSDPSAASETSGETGAEETALFRAFEAGGFEVSRGHASSFLIADCEAIDDCFGNNPSSPYMLFSVPGHPSDPATLPATTVGEVPKIPEGMSPAARLEAGEAIVIVGTTPPRAKYLGFTPYLFERRGPNQRVTVFASLVDTLNHVNLRTPNDDPFSSEVAIIVTSDAPAFEAARAALLAEGYPESAINALVLPRDVLRFGLDADDDVVQLIGRVALFDDAAQGDAYLADVPLEVFRLTPETSGDAMPVPERAVRGDGSDEVALQGAVDALETAIETSLGTTPFESVQVAAAGAVALAIDPERCIENLTECLGDNSDAAYAAGPLTVFQGEGELTLAEDEAFVLYGVNHAAAGMAEYSAAAVYSRDKRMGVVTLNDEQMVGTADRFVPDHPDRDKLFAIDVRRDCTGSPHCLELGTEFPGIALEENLFFMFRAYVQPGSTVSPAPDSLLGERAIKILAP
jgi:hypothetical protein